MRSQALLGCSKACLLAAMQTNSTCQPGTHMPAAALKQPGVLAERAAATLWRGACCQWQWRQGRARSKCPGAGRWRCPGWLLAWGACMPPAATGKGTYSGAQAGISRSAGQHSKESNRGTSTCTHSLRRSKEQAEEQVSPKAAQLRPPSSSPSQRHGLSMSPWVSTRSPQQQAQTAGWNTSACLTGTAAGTGVLPGGCALPLPVGLGQSLLQWVPAGQL